MFHGRNEHSLPWFRNKLGVCTRRSKNCRPNIRGTNTISINFLSSKPQVRVSYIWRYARSTWYHTSLSMCRAVLEETGANKELKWETPILQEDWKPTCKSNAFLQKPPAFKSHLTARVMRKPMAFDQPVVSTRQEQKQKDEANTFMMSRTYLHMIPGIQTKTSSSSRKEDDWRNGEICDVNEPIL